MIICGCEEPLRVNPYLDPGPAAPRTVLDNPIQEPRLNRYTFILAEPSTAARATFAELLQQISIHMSLPMTWCMRRPLFTGTNDRFPSLSWIARRKKAAWQLYTDETLAIAVQPVATLTPTLRPPDYQPAQADESSFLLLGPSPAPSALAQEPFRSALKEFRPGTSWPLEKQALVWLAENQQSLAFAIRDHLGVNGMLILISPQRVPFDDLVIQPPIEKRDDAWRFLYS